MERAPRASPDASHPTPPPRSRLRLRVHGVDHGAAADHCGERAGGATASRVTTAADGIAVPPDGRESAAPWRWAEPARDRLRWSMESPTGLTMPAGRVPRTRGGGGEPTHRRPAAVRRPDTEETSTAVGLTGPTAGPPPGSVRGVGDHSSGTCPHRRPPAAGPPTHDLAPLRRRRREPGRSSTEAPRPPPPPTWGLPSTRS
jgi:hypothetical protein